MTKIQYASDLHLDYFAPTLDYDEFLTPSAPILVLAGDIASVWSQTYSNFLCWCSWNWEHVILIAGNHEYHCKSFEKHTRKSTDQEIRKIARSFNNIHFLQMGESFHLPNSDIVFIGTTLYSDIDPIIYEEITTKYDFKTTFVETKNQDIAIRNTTPADFVKFHKRHRQAISDAIRSIPRGFKVIVITHYLPTERLLEDEYQHDRLKSCYATKMDTSIRKPTTVWICGHSHRSTQLLTLNNILLARNARGNKQYELNRDVDIYNKRAVITL